MNVDTNAWVTITNEWAHAHPVYALVAALLVYLPLALAAWIARRLWRVAAPRLGALRRAGAGALDRIAEAGVPQPEPPVLPKRLPPLHGVAEQPRMEAYPVAHREVVAFADIRDANREWAACTGAEVWAEHQASEAAQARPPHIRALGRLIRTRRGTS